MRYRKRPVVVDAIQFTGDNAEEIITFTRRAAYIDYDGHLRLSTLEGPMAVWPDWWVIRGVEGESYPCKPSVFNTTYEAIGSRTPSEGGAAVADHQRAKAGGPAG